MIKSVGANGRTRRARFRTAAAALLVAAGQRAMNETARSTVDAQETALDRFPAASLRIASPPAGSVPEVDLQRDFGAAGDGVQDDTPAFRMLAAAVNAGWVWDVHFLSNTSHPLSVGRSRRVVVCEAVFDRARHVGGGGNGYLPEIYYTDDSMVAYCTNIAGRHALVCNWTCWGNVFRYNRLDGTPNTETHGEYSVENLYLRNDCRGARMEVGGGGDSVHAHDGPFNELRENYAQVLRVLKRQDRHARLAGNWHVAAIDNRGTDTVQEENQRVPPGWSEYPYAPFCGHDHAETARPS